MAKLYTSQEFINKLKWLVYDVPNVYYSGKYWSQKNKEGKFQFDCVVSIKSLLWGFKGNNEFRGGTVYKSNGVADFSCNGALDYCSDVSTDFSHLVAGEYVCMKGTKYNHSGMCIEPATSTKRGKMFEDTTGWGTKRAIISEFDTKGYRYYNGVKNVAKWTYHGKLRWIDYSQEPKPFTQVMLWQTKMNEQWNCGLEVDGSFGPACTREGNKHQLYYGVKAPIMIKWLQTRLKELGYDLAVDGSFGPDTRRKVMNFQKFKKISVDGYVGSATYKALTE